MPTVRAICTDALNEIGVLGEAEAMSGPQGALALLRFQHQIDAWAADRLTLAIQTRTVFTLLSGTSTVTLGPAPADVVMERPVWVDTVNFIVPRSSPPVESPIAIMNRDQYAAVTIKALPSQLPTQCFYQTSLTTPFGSLFFWPTVSQNVDIALYTPTAIGTPVSLNSILTGPEGYQEAFMYGLAVRLLTPFGVKAQDVPLLVGPDGFASKALAVVKRRNVQPGLLGVDPAIVLQPMGGRYNVLTNTGG